MNIEDLVAQLKSLNEVLGIMQQEKRDVEAHILGICGYNGEGQKTHTMASGDKLVVRGGTNYRIDQKLVLDHMSKFPINLVPVKKKVSYELDKKIYDMLSLYPSYRDIADSFVIASPKAIKIEVML